MTDTAPGPRATPKQIKEALGYTNTAQFATDWRDLSPEDKDDLRQGVSDGSMTY